MIMSTQTGATYLSKKYQALNTKSLIYGLNSTYKASFFIKYPTNIAPPIPLIGSKIFEAVKSRKSKKFLPKSINLSPTFSIFYKYPSTNYAKCFFPTHAILSDQEKDKWLDDRDG